ALDMDRADHRVIGRRPNLLQRDDMLAGKPVDQQIVAVIGDQARQGIVGLELKRLSLRHP
ncbi:MAG: hypothetical protein QF767_16125, partial [Alphaproteobacteria bacterium]|nr:hypothetical protein [Alphaproteobacteria bacterium]